MHLIFDISIEFNSEWLMFKMNIVARELQYCLHLIRHVRLKKNEQKQSARMFSFLFSYFIFHCLFYFYFLFKVMFYDFFLLDFALFFYYCCCCFLLLLWILFYIFLKSFFLNSAKTHSTLIIFLLFILFFLVKTKSMNESMNWPMFQDWRWW